MESATPASNNGSSDPRENILDKLQRLANEDPTLEAYHITTEIEAQELLLAMAAMLKVMAKDVKVEIDRRVLKDYANQYRAATIQGKAMEYLRELDADDELELFGLKITVPAIIIQ